MEENFERPWPPTGLTTQEWIDTIPVVEVDLTELVFTQDVRLLYVLWSLQGHGNFTADPYPHVIIWRGVKYIEDGHHRIAKLLIRGEKHTLARVIDMDERLDSVQKS